MLKLKSTASTAAEWADRIAELETDLAGVASERQRLSSERASAALAAVAEDASAKRTVARIDAELTTLQSRSQTLSDAIQAARAHRDQALTAEIAESEADKHVRLQRAVSELLLADERLDTAMASYAELGITGQSSARAGVNLFGMWRVQRLDQINRQ